MSEGPVPQGMAGAARNPATDPETLRQIAFHYPELRPVVAANPSAYEGLLDWLGALNDPEINTALQQRDQSQSDRTEVIPAASGEPSGAPIFAPAEPRPGLSAQDAVNAQVAQSSASPLAGWETPAHGVGATVPATQPRRSKGMKIALISLVVLALALVALVVAIINGVFAPASSNSAETGTSQSEGTQAAQSATTEEGANQDPSESPSPSPSPSDLEERYPAPAGAAQMTNFVSPSGNILCELAADSVTCTIIEQNYAQNGFADCGADRTTLRAGLDGVGLSCGTSAMTTAAQLSYGASAASGHSACVSNDSGVACWNTVSGQGFALARQGWQTGTSGQIPPDAFRW